MSREAAGRPACRPVWAMSFPELVLRRGAQEALINRAEWRIRGAVQDRTLELEGVWSEPMPLIRAGDFIDIDAEGKVERFLVTEAGVTQETLEMATIGAGRTVHRQRVGRGDVTIEARPTDFAPGPPPPKPLATQAEEAERRLAETREACEGFDLDDLT